MFPKITLEGFKTSLLMHLDNPKMRVVLVEGENDWGVISKFIPKKFVFFFTEDEKNNKNTVISSVKWYNKKYKRNSSRLIGIIDRDFDLIQHGDKRFIPKNLFYTDNHDLDVQIFLSIALDNYFKARFYEPWKINYEDICNSCLELALHYDLYILTCHDLNISKNKIFNKIREIEHYIDEKFQFLDKRLEQDYEELYEDLYPDLFDEKFLKFLNQVKNRKKGLNKQFKMDVINGHNLIRVFSLMIIKEYRLKRKQFDKLDKQKYIGIDGKITGKFNSFSSSVEGDLRNAYDSDCFYNSQLSQEIMNFQDEKQVNFLNNWDEK